MNKIIILTIIAVALILEGCASKLEVEHSPDGNGIVVSAPTAHVITKEVKSYDKNRVPCPDKTVVTRDFVNLPFGELYTINIDPSWFAANEFSIEFNDSGVLKKVILNSDPQLDETITATANLVKEVGAAAAAIAPAGAGVLALGPDQASCGTFKTEKILKVQTYQEWKSNPYNP